MFLKTFRRSSGEGGREFEKGKVWGQAWKAAEGLLGLSGEIVLPKKNSIIKIKNLYQALNLLIKGEADYLNLQFHYR